MAAEKNVVLAGYLIKSPPQEKLVAVSDVKCHTQRCVVAIISSQACTVAHKRRVLMPSK